MFETKRISKLKIDGARVEISGKSTWGVGNEREWTQRTCEEPAPELPAEIAKLPAEIRKLLELPETWAEGALKVVSISFSWSETTEVRGASICCRADLECATSPLIFNTPHLPYAQYSETGEQPLMPDAMIDILERVEAMAVDYLGGGMRAQGDLFDVSKSAKDRAAGETSETTIGQATDELVRQVGELIGQAADDKPAKGKRKVAGTVDEVAMT